MAKVLDFLYVGDKKIAKDKDLLKSLSISHILNCTPRRSVDPIAGVPNYFPTDFTYERCEIYDNDSSDFAPLLNGCLDFINTGKHYGSILVHCNKGVSRSVTVVIAFLIKYHNMKYDDALEKVRITRPIAQPNESFSNQLRILEAQCRANKLEGVTRDKSKPVGAVLPPPLSKKVVEILCEECDKGKATIHCGKCGVKYCEGCCKSSHLKLGDHVKSFVKISESIGEEKENDKDKKRKFEDINYDHPNNSNIEGEGKKMKSA